MLNKILIFALSLILASCASKKNISATDSSSALRPITIHYSGDQPPPIIFVKDKTPSIKLMPPNYIQYGDSYWWWHAH